MARDPKHLLVVPLDQLVRDALSSEDLSAKEPDEPPHALLKGLRKIRQELDELEAELGNAAQSDEASDSPDCPEDCEGCPVCDE